MKKFKTLISEIAEPRGGDEKKFKKRHVDATDKKPHPQGNDHVFKGKEKAPARLADISDDEAMYDDQYVDDGDEGEVSRDFAAEEKLDEISQGKLTNYISAASDSRRQKTARQADKRAAGVNMALKKAMGKAKVNATEETLIEAVKAGTVRLGDGSTQKITKEDASSLNKLFTQLNDSNRTKMEQRMTKSKAGFAEILQFAKNI